MFVKNWKAQQPRQCRIFPYIIVASILLSIGWLCLSMFFFQPPSQNSGNENNLTIPKNNAEVVRTETVNTKTMDTNVHVAVPWMETFHNDKPEAVISPTHPAIPTKASKPIIKGLESDFHIIFSTGCSPFQDWQSLLLFLSALDVGQKDPITRIASGCSPEDEARLIDMHKTLPRQFRIHFTPDFSRDPLTGKEYYFYNKPFGLLHFLDNVNPPLPPDVVLGLIDPDMIFLRPLSHVIDSDSVLFSSPVTTADLFDKVSLGHPVGQHYMIGAKWLEFNVSKNFVSDSEAWKFYSVGPPYIAHNKDFQRIATSWVDAVPKVYIEYPYLLAEMYAYSIAAAFNQLPHLRLHHYMVSNIDVGVNGEAWQFIDELEYIDICPVLDDGEGIQDHLASAALSYNAHVMPVFLHYCQFYRADAWAFHKRHLPDDVFSCSSPLLDIPPANLSYSVQKVKTREKKIEKFSKPIFGKRSAFMICTISHAINQAAVRYKQMFCGKDANLEKTMRLD